MTSLLSHFAIFIHVILGLFTTRNLSDSTRPVPLQSSLGMLIGSVLLIFLVLLLHLVAGDGAAMYIKDNKQILPSLSITPSHLLQLVGRDVEVMNPNEREQLLSSPQDMDQKTSPPKDKDQILYPTEYMDQLLSPPQDIDQNIFPLNDMDQIFSPPKDMDQNIFNLHDMDQNIFPPKNKFKRAGFYIPSRMVDMIFEDLAQAKGQYILRMK